MANRVYDFLTESFLFQDEEIASGYHAYTTAQLEHELQRYREFVESSWSEVFEEVQGGSRDLVVIADQKDVPPSDSLLKQCSLYTNKFVISDPIFKLTQTKGEIHQALSKAQGFAGKPLQQELATAASYMRKLTPLVAGGFVKFAPISKMHEPPESLPVLASDVGFSDVLPPNILRWFHERATLFRIHKADKGLFWSRTDGTQPCRQIGLIFQDGDSSLPALRFQLLPINGSSEVLIFAVDPDALPPPDLTMFQSWIWESTNRAAMMAFDGIAKDLFIADSIGASILTERSIVSSLLSQSITSSHHIPTSTLNAVLRLELPFVQDASFENLMRVRNSEGEVFERFRSFLESKLMKLRQLSTDQAQIEQEEVQHELKDRVLKEVEFDFNRARKLFLQDAAVAVISTSAAVQTGNGLLSLGVGLINAWRTWSGYQHQVTRHPAYFLWKLKR